MFNIKAQRDESLAIFEDYYEKFGERFPLMELGPDENKARECIKNNKTVDEMGFVNYEDDIKY